MNKEDKIKELADEYYNAMKVYFDLSDSDKRKGMTLQDWVFARRNNWKRAEKAFDELNEMGEGDRAICPLTRRQDEDGNWLKWDGSKWVLAYPPNAFGQKPLR
tara:strand:+ start:993 stop:1301 length:309 start_codon:yes stop_codon:yes gene_type:complete